ncbi:MAG: hypothetical protein NTW86_05605 [Candidatus Sumerlaeota bacterium]|nr:hypothetical protein [Candidatus Sumerlaeota bacterium]
MTNQNAFAPLPQRTFVAMNGVDFTQSRQPKGEMILALQKGHRVINLSGAGNARMHGPDDTADNSAPDLLEPMASALAKCLKKIEKGVGDR